MNENETTIANDGQTLTNDRLTDPRNVRAVDLLANDGYANIPMDKGNGMVHGEVCLANASRFIESNFSEPLTTFAVGWKDPNKIDEALEFVAPMVSTSHRFEYASATNAEEFQSETDDVRAIGSDFGRVEYTSSKVNAKTLNKGLIIRVDEDNVDDMPNWREIYTGRIMRRLLRNELRRAIKLLVANAAAITSKTWNNTAGLDPDQDAALVVENFGDVVGVSPNRILYGLTAWNKRRIAHRAQNTAGGFASAGLSPSDVAGYLGLDDAYVSRERYTTGTQLNPTKTRVTVASTPAGASDIAVVFLAEAGQTPEDPSNIKRFVSSTAGGTPFRVYEQRISAKLVDISVEHYSNIIITSPLGIQVLAIS